MLREQIDIRFDSSAFEEQTKARSLGAQAYLVKPCQPQSCARLWRAFRQDSI